jgi:hypothetical protein
MGLPVAPAPQVGRKTMRISPAVPGGIDPHTPGPRWWTRLATAGTTGLRTPLNTPYAGGQPIAQAPGSLTVPSGSVETTV